MVRKVDINPISGDKRNLSGPDYFLLWAGVAISLAEIWAGGFLAPMGLWLGFLAILLGHLIGNTFMAMGGIIGSQYGIMSMVSVRPSFGIRGSNLAAILNIIQLIGWASIMLIIGGRAGAMLGKSTGGILASNHFWIIAIGLGTLIWAQLTGKPVWRILQKLAVIGLLVLIVLMSGVSFREFGSDVFKIKPGEMPFMIGLDLVIAMPISWMPLAADYARFSRRTAPAFWNTWLGYFLISSWMYALGLAATLVTGTSDPGSLLLELMGKIGLAVPALAMVVFSTITTGFPDVYSAACSTMNISQKFSSRTIVWAAGTISILVALVFPMEQYENFLFLIGAMFVPLFGVVLTDYFLIRKRQLNVEDIYRVDGQYWYTKGFNGVALICWVIGFLVYQLITLLKYPLGGSMPSLLVAGLCYYFITRRQHKRDR
ncbi:MAG: putative hydroxymethylpyrimidine transporter CytX [Deltaproteobacteria bacterium]|nr:putative hydroxymethylpyrimidine transporter CytX [Deltaproteobacteria bacterium]